jgi:RHS repeat-associated protein
MLHAPRTNARRLFNDAFALALIYALLLSLCAPLTIRRVEATPAEDNARTRRHAPVEARRANANRPLQGNRRRDSELLVRFRETASEQDRTDAIERRGGRRARRLSNQSRVERIELPAGLDPDVAAQELRLDPTIEAVEPNFLIARDQTTPSDSRFSEQWSLRNTGQSGGLTGSDINVLPAWERTTGSPQTVIAVVDSGVDFTHPDLRNNQWTNTGEQNNNSDDDQNGYMNDLRGWDFVTNTGEIRDYQGHGTAIAGIIAAEGNNSEGVSGVMWRASLMSLRVLDQTGTGDIGRAIEAIDYAVEMGARVINCSWGTDQASTFLREAIERANSRGVVVICSAGNGGRNLDVQPYYPASYNLPNVIGVAASNNFDQLAAESNYGRARITLAAPGANILTTRIGGGYMTMSGTSAAAAVVAGVAGLIKTLRWWQTPAGTRAAILDGARRVGDLQGSVSSGGVVNAAGALNALQGPDTPPPTPSSTPGEGNNNENGNENSSGQDNGQGGGGGRFPVPLNPAGGQGRSHEFRVPAPEPLRGAPAGMPNLDELRRQRPTPPRIADPVPSRHRYCWPGDPACQPRRQAPPAPTPPPRPSQSPSPSPTPSLASSRATIESPFGVLSAALTQSQFSDWPVPAFSQRTGGHEAVAVRGVERDQRVYHPTESGRTQTAMKETARVSTTERADTGTSGATTTTLEADCQNVWGYAGANTLIYIYKDGVDHAQTYSDGAGYFTYPLYILDPESHHIAAWYYDYWGNWLHIGETWVSGCGDFSNPRLDPRNETGQPGVDRGSQNINWGVPVVNLAGRSGLDLSLSLVYNSLVWTRSGNSMMYDADHGTPSPGFRLGLPIIQPRFYNSTAGVYAYMMVTSSGRRVELRQIGASTIYEPADGSFTQMIDYGTSALVRTMDGTQMTFYPSVNNEMRCTEIKDRNGNFITISYYAHGGIYQITDTLGRVLTFNYDVNDRLLSITQARNGGTYTWATFGYDDRNLQPDFPGLYVVAPANPVSLLTRVNLPDGSSYRFDYTPFGQVSVIRRHAPDDHQLAYTSYNMGTGPHSDCPRFSQQREWAENWNNGAEALTSYSTTLDANGNAEWSQVTVPDGTIHREFYYTSGWQKGLTYQTETWSGGVRRRYTTMLWTQDDTNLTYQKNPRPWDMSVYDEANNRRRTTIEYQGFSLPHIVREYGGTNGDQQLRYQVNHYRWDSHYIDRRIIGLPGLVLTYDGAGALMSKLEYYYDIWSEYGYLQASAPSVQHDTANYGAGFSNGRGNLVAVRRYDVRPGFENDWNQGVWVLLQGYNLAGSVVFRRNHLEQWTTNISYTDSFADGINRGTLAYPTSVTDPDGYTSTRQYEYALGAVTRVQTPQPNQTGNVLGPVQTIAYDAAGRVERVTNLTNNAYTRWVYSTAGDYVQQFMTLQAGAGESYSIQVRDGAGRVYRAAEYHPGSVGGYRAAHVVYDAMGRVTQQSKPTEITGGWLPTGDDAVGWVYTLQAYDWMGRPTLTTLPDGYTREISYTSCGCAGGDVATMRDEAGRRRRLVKDALGRLDRVEELNWDQSIYSTASYTYNGRDQLTAINHQGQVRSFGYDGHGRLTTRTTPEQGQTSYSYYNDDTLQTVTDARGASATYTYNGRGLVTGVNYGVPGGVAPTPNITFSYDAAGNRLGMDDGPGTVSYSYDTLSRLTSETRSFDGVGSFTLTYGYNLAGQLTSITNPWNAQVGYTRDHMGQATAVTGSGYSSVSIYASNIQYRAFGGVKAETYGNARQFTATYDNRMRVRQWDVGNVMGWEYNYDYLGESTGRVSYARNLYDGTLDRSYDYDQVGRLSNSHSGAEARAHVGLGPWGILDGPYSHYYISDQRGNLVQRGGWGGEHASYTLSFDANNRRAGSTYDASGNVTHDGGQAFEYDATGQQVTASHATTQMGYDGDRLRVRRVENGVTTYFIRSSVLGGQVVAEINSSGGWTRGYVYDDGGNLLALQQDGVVEWTHQDPVVKSQRLTNQSGTVIATVELDPWGGETARSSNSARQPRRYTTYTRDANASDEAMHRRYNRWWSRFDQPDPYDGSYDLTDPQSFNRYSYVQNDPVNFTDPSGLFALPAEEPREPPPGWDLPRWYPIPGFGGGIVMPVPELPAGGEPPFIPIELPAPSEPQQNIPCTPTGAQMANNPVVRRALDRAFRDSGYNTQNAHEEGGWIFADENNNLRVARATRGTGGSINLNNPPLVMVRHGWRLVGDFHTHPYRDGQQVIGEPPGVVADQPQHPSKRDERLAAQRGTPALIRHPGGIRIYGPNPPNPCP